MGTGGDSAPLLTLEGVAAYDAIVERLDGLAPCEGAMVGILATAIIAADYDLPRALVEGALREALDVAILSRKGG